MLQPQISMARHSDPIPDLPWHFPVRVEDVPETGLHVVMAADENTRAAIARLAGLRALPRLKAEFNVVRHGRDSLAVTGEVSASVGQVCVVTLEPVDNEVTEPIHILFKPAHLTTVAGSERRADQPALDAEADEVEPLVDGVADLGALATEFLLLGIDPYPRKPGAVFQPPTPAESAAGPFAALAALKPRRGGS